MKTTPRRIIFLILFSVGSLAVNAQRLELDHVELAGDKVVVHYNLEDQNANHRYLINLFTSNDNFSTPLTRVAGDVGTDVAPGYDRKITWDITRELGPFKGDLTFEVRGRVFIPFVKLVDFGEGKVFKRGRNYPITWTSGNLSGQVNIELFRNEERIMGESNLPNIGKYDWYIPGSVKKGDNYRLKFTSTKDRNDIQYSRPFAIRPRTPFILKALGVAAIGAAVVFLQSATDDEPTPPGTPEVEDPLPDNPGLPDD